MTKQPELSWKLRAMEYRDSLSAEMSKTADLSRQIERLERKQTEWTNKNIDLQFKLAKIQGVYGRT